MKNLEREAWILRDQLRGWRRDFHRHPEPAMQEFRTAEIIEQELGRLQIGCRRVGETGILGILRGELPGERVVALRADIDALPIQEQNAVEYRSENDGVMHACGHDVHTSCLLGAARILAERRKTFGGEVRFFFQPAEEIGKGAMMFIRDGALEGVERVFGLHTAPDLPIGKVGLTPGLNNAAVDHFTVRVYGKSSHVSAPHLGVDALYIASQIVVPVQALVTRMTSPVEPAVIGIGKMISGTTYNAVAEYAELEGTTRTVSVATRARIRRQVTETAEAVAAVYGGTAVLEWEEFTAPLINHKEATREAAQLAEAFLGSGHVISDRELSLSGDDFAEYILRVPGTYAYLGTANQDQPGTQFSIYNGNFDVDENALPIGTALYSGYALYWLSRDPAPESIA